MERRITCAEQIRGSAGRASMPSESGSASSNSGMHPPGMIEPEAKEEAKDSGKGKGKGKGKEVAKEEAKVSDKGKQ